VIFLDTIVNGMIAAFRKLFMKGASAILVEMADVATGIFDIKQVKSIADLFEYIGWILLIIGILFAISNYAIKTMEGESDGLYTLIINICISILIIYFLYPVCKYLFDDLYKDLLELIKVIFTTNGKITDAEVAFAIFNQANGEFSKFISALGVLWVLILSIFLFYVIFSVLIQILKRSGIFILQIFIGYLHIFSIPQGSYSGFISWSKITFALMISQIIQWTLYYLGLDLISNLSIKKFLLGVGVLLAGKEVDRYMNYFSLAGGGNLKLGAINAVRNISSIVSTFKK
jgi:hypothetical protein